MTENLKEGAIYQGKDKFSPIPLTVNSPKIEPEDMRMVKANAFEGMKHHAEQQISILKKQAEVIMQQVRDIEKRIEISYEIYKADISFEPVIGQTYYLYQKNAKKKLSLIGPNEWGGKLPFDTCIAKVKLLADRTWEVEENLS